MGSESELQSADQIGDVFRRVYSWSVHDLHGDAYKGSAQWRIVSGGKRFAYHTESHVSDYGYPEKLPEVGSHIHDEHNYEIGYGDNGWSDHCPRGPSFYELPGAGSMTHSGRAERLI